MTRILTQKWAHLVIRRTHRNAHYSFGISAFPPDFLCLDVGKVVLYQTGLTWRVRPSVSCHTAKQARTCRHPTIRAPRAAAISFTNGQEGDGAETHLFSFKPSCGASAGCLYRWAQSLREDFSLCFRETCVSGRQNWGLGCSELSVWSDACLVLSSTVPPLLTHQALALTHFATQISKVHKQVAEDYRQMT